MVFISYLEMNGIEVILPEDENQDINFLKLFSSYIFNCSAVLCNASSLVLSIAFLSHEYIYLPSRKNILNKVVLNDAHNSYPTNLNWN